MMTFQAAPRRLYPARIYTSEMILEGQMEPVGPLLDDLNDPTKSGILLHDVQVVPLVAGSSQSSFALETATAQKSDFHLVYLSDPQDHDALNLMKRTEPLIIYTSHFVIRGNLHMGGETRVRDLADGLPSLFLAVSAVTIYPLFQPAITIPKSYSLLLINKTLVRLYHPATAAPSTT